MTQTVEGPAQQEPLSQLLGLGLLRTSWRLFAAHWWRLLAIASCAYVAHDLVMELALWAYRAGALPGFLVFSLVPLVPLIGTVLMLLVLREHQHGGGVTGFVAAIGSVLIPFLVVYESQGDFLEDLSTFLNGGFQQLWEEQAAEVLAGGQSNFDQLNIDTSAPLVLAVVVAAFLLRAVGARFAGNDTLWQGGARRLRVPLRMLVGYSEVVWIVIGASVVTTGLRGLHDWWQDRRVGRALEDWWEGFIASFPSLGAFGEWIVTAIGTLLDGAVSGLVAPLAWLTIGVVVYGLSAADSIAEDEVVDAVSRSERLGRVTQRVNPAVITLAWRRIADPEGRFGALLGGIAMILRSRFVPVIVFCLLYTAISTWLPYLVWWLARTVLPRFDYRDWLAAYGPLQALAQIAVLCLTAPLLAAWADALLTRFGARSQLRLPEPPH